MTAVVHDLRRKKGGMRRRPLSAERKIGLILEGLRGHRPVRELCRHAGISRACYYRWRHQFLDAGRMGLGHSETESYTLKERVQYLEAENVSLRVQTRLFQELCMAD
jgi:transposase-like protein